MNERQTTQERSPIVIREFTCRRDNLTIRGNVYTHEQIEDTVEAMIISHGFMGNQENLKDYALAFAQTKQRAVYTFDFCGGCLKGTSDGETTAMSVLTEVEDLKAVIEYVRGQKRHKDSRLFLMGCSQGGFVSAITAAQLQGIDGLVLFYPALCIPDDARKGSMQAASFDPNHVPDDFYCGLMHLGAVYALDVMEMDAFSQIEGYKGPVLIIHGDQDRIVDVEYAKRAFVLYEKNAEPVRLRIIPGAGHGFVGPDRDQAVEETRTFLGDI